MLTRSWLAGTAARGVRAPPVPHTSACPPTDTHACQPTDTRFSNFSGSPGYPAAVTMATCKPSESRSRSSGRWCEHGCAVQACRSSAERACRNQIRFAYMCRCQLDLQVSAPLCCVMPCCWFECLVVSKNEAWELHPHTCMFDRMRLMM